MELARCAYDVIIQAGQSNAEGFGKGPVSEEYLKDDDVVYLYQNFKAEVKSIDGFTKMVIQVDDPTFHLGVADEAADNDGKIGSFALTFAEEYKKAGLLAEGRKLLIIRAAVGGTGFFAKQWGVGDELYLRMLEMIDYALSLNPDNKIVGFLWHQGEHDAFEGNPPDVFESQLKAMITDVKNRYGLIKLPFVSGDFVNEWKSKNIEICKPIVEKIRSVTASEGGVFIETADLPSNNQTVGNGDDIHFCRESLHILGKRYFNAYSEIVKA